LVKRTCDGCGAAGGEQSELLFIVHLPLTQTVYTIICLQCFDAVDWAQEGHSGCKKLSGGVLAWLSV